MDASLGAVLAVFLVSAVAALAVRQASSIARREAATPPERAPFAGGEAPRTHAQSRFHARYYVMALVFVAFDMEMVFMYPWAVVFVREGLTAFVEMAMFIVILLLGILYAWRERALRWS